MRTTIRFRDDLLRQVEARASADGRTLNDVVEEAVRVWLEPSTAHAVRPSVPVCYKGGGLLYAFRAEFPEHATYRRWLDRLLAVGDTETTSPVSAVRLARRASLSPTRTTPRSPSSTTASG